MTVPVPPRLRSGAGVAGLHRTPEQQYRPDRYWPRHYWPPTPTHGCAPLAIDDVPHRHQSGPSAVPHQCAQQPPGFAAVRPATPAAFLPAGQCASARWQPVVDRLALQLPVVLLQPTMPVLLPPWPLLQLGNGHPVLHCAAVQGASITGPEQHARRPQAQYGAHTRPPAQTPQNDPAPGYDPLQQWSLPVAAAIPSPHPPTPAARAGWSATQPWRLTQLLPRTHRDPASFFFSRSPVPPLLAGFQNFDQIQFRHPSHRHHTGQYRRQYHHCRSKPQRLRGKDQWNPVQLTFHQTHQQPG